MYNKYLTMKRSQLKEAIKAEIKSVLLEEEEKFQMTYKGDPVDLKISKFGGNAEGARDTVLFVNVGGIGKRRSKASKNALEKRKELLNQKVDKIMFTNKDNISKEIKDISPSDFKITSVLSEQSNNPDFDKKVASFAKKINNEMDYPGGVLEAMKQIKSRLERIIGKVEDAKRGGAEEEPLMKMAGLSEAEYTDRVGKSRLASNKSKQADEFNKSYDSVAQAAAEKQFDDDVMDKAASKRAKKEPIGKEAERLAQVQKFMKQMQDKGIVGKDKKILDTPKYKEEFAKFKAGLKK